MTLLLGPSNAGRVLRTLGLRSQECSRGALAPSRFASLFCPSNAGRAGLLALLLSLAACGGAPPPEEHFYRLSVPALGKADQTLPGILTVERFSADGVTGERPMTYSRSADDKNLKSWRYHFWAEAPGRMLEHLLAKALEQSKAADQVLSDEARVSSNWLLKGRLIHFEQVLNGSPKVVIEADVTLMKARDYSLVHHTTYREEEPADGESPAAAVEAMQKAFDRLSARIAKDLRAR